MDLVQKSSSLIERRRRKQGKMDRKDEYVRKIAEARQNFLKKHNVNPADMDDQKGYLKIIQRHMNNLCQYPSLTVREFVQVKILSGNSPNEIFLIKKTDEANAYDFIRQLTDEYSHTVYPLVYCLKTGTLCTANTQKGWQRCTIIKLHENQKCDVQLFDIGAAERVDWYDLRMLGDKWIDIKPLAIRCALISMNSARPIERFSWQQQQQFTKILLNQTEFYIFVNKAGVILSEIYLYYKYDDQFYCLNEVFPGESPSEASDDGSIDELTIERSRRTPPSQETSTRSMHFSAMDMSLSSKLPQNDRSEKSLQFQRKLDKNSTCSFVEERKENENEMKKLADNENEKLTENNVENGKENENENGKEKENENEYGKENGKEKEKGTSSGDSVDGVEKKCKLSLTEPVVVRHMDGINSIYVCFSKYSVLLQTMSFNIALYLQDPPKNGEIVSANQWNAGDYCLVSEDFSEWHRGKIVSISDAEKCMVYMRDVGKSVKSNISDLKPISDELKNVRDFVWEVRLSGIKVKSGYSSVDINELLWGAVGTYDEMAISGFGEIGGVILWGIRKHLKPLFRETSEYVNINEELVKWNVATTTASFDGIKELVIPPQDEPNIDSDDSMQTGTPAYCVSVQKLDVKQWLASERNRKLEFPAFPMYVSQKCVLSVLDSNRKNIADEIKGILEKKAKELISQDPIEWKKDDACFARFDVDRRFYRATITRVNFARNDCRVRFVDYGNCETCELGDLRKATMFGNIPVLARQYQLHNIRPLNADGIWTDHARQFCINLVVEKQCNLLVMNEPPTESSAAYEIETCKLEIFTKQKDLASALVMNNLADWIVQPSLKDA